MAFASIQEAVNSTVFLTTPKEKNQDRHKQGYFHAYYLKNKENFLTYNHDYYQVKKLIEPYIKSEKKNADRHRLGY
jgi:hypothetical protein